MTDVPTLSRRGFVLSLLAASGALVIGTRPILAAVVDAEPWTKDTPTGAHEFTPWLSIAPNGQVTVMVTTPDIGNGVVTQALSFVYEELGARWDDLRAQYASTSSDYALGGVYSKVNGSIGYFGGRSTSDERRITYMTAAANARERLRHAAAAQWNVPVGEVEARDGLIHHAASGRSTPFGALLAHAASVALPEDPKPKRREEWTHLGKDSPAKVQNPLVVSGAAVYGIDVKIPGKVYAALRQSPVMGGRLKSYDFESIRHMPGVRTVVEIKPTPANEKNILPSPFPMETTRIQAAVAVIADHYWQARTALDALPIEWEDGPGGKWENTQAMADAAMAVLDKPGGKVDFQAGDARADFAKGGKIIDASYLTPYCEHMPMEPLNGTALVTDKTVELWHPSQHTQMAFTLAVQQTGFAPENVTVHQTFVGGGFGRRAYGDDARMVVAVAQQYPGVPVHTIWSREESTRQGRYRAMVAGRLKARLGEDGLPTAFEAHGSGGPGMNFRGVSDTVFPQIVPNAHVETHILPDLHVLNGPYRGPGYNSGAFIMESFVDELANAAGVDPMEYRIRLYAKWQDKAWVKVLEELRDKSGWGQPLPKGQARGVAIGNWGMRGKPFAGTTCGAVAHAEVTQDGKLTIHRLDIAFDSGRILNRDAVRAELEGGAIFGLNMSLNEELNVEHGRIVEGNFHEYPMLRIGDIPQLHIHFGGLSDNERYYEIGEPPVGPVGPSVANAIFAVTGKRLRTTPFRKQDLRWGEKSASAG
ncbi:aldehyde dehydrogenase [Azorhizobium oxalatiphilum]|uniref:Aldehyde dehydrogenase n=1 Tax=Azorhizobium oxalatiphilum TaxID=980631 RepID=A0A917FAH5_9HYPH|nr:molybdopterin cofactor-binding domain-containing protein [Azorhizobium oxalatiphilum]GGF62432.1 aldehyde dehydrogenase [Azorhizobium oxalatiphilum]